MDYWFIPIIIAAGGLIVLVVNIALRNKNKGVTFIAPILPKMTEKDFAQLKDFKAVSLRGLTAYGICCLENALLHFNLSGEGWDFYLDKLWLYTSTPETMSEHGNDLENLIYALSKSCPDNINEMVEKGTYGDYYYFKIHFSEEEMNLLFETYKNLPGVISKIIEAVNEIQMAEFNGHIIHLYYLTLSAVENLLKIMRENSITSPNIEKFKKYGWLADKNTVEPLFHGELFNGLTEFSVFKKP